MHGVVPGMGGMERLARLLGKEKAIQMILAGEMISAKDALSSGLVTKLSEQKNCLDEALSFAKELISGKSIAQINAIINTVNEAFDDIEDPSKGRFEAVLAEVNRK